MIPEETKIFSNKENGDLLSVIENIIDFKRLFFINVKDGKKRGNHAHKDCTQYLFSINGSVIVNVTNSFDRYKFVLKPGKNLLKVPPLWWASQIYEKNSILGVLCDMNYDEDDYIRDWQIYLKLMKNETT